ncbi:pyridoxal-phosphate dependent enzyme [Sorangium sp. So ce134]
MWMRLQEFRAQLGGTPLLEIVYPGHAPILAKLEYLNPTGSIKDRPAFAIIAHLLRSLPDERLAGVRVVDYSGGNFGRSLAVLCRLLGWELHIATGRWCSAAFCEQLRSLGAAVHIADGDGFWAVMELAGQLKQRDPGLTFLDQTNNIENYNAHFSQTALEILRQLAGRVPAAWVASVGSGGTFAGVYDRLISVYPELTSHVVTPEEQPFGDERPANNLPKYQGSGGLALGRKQRFIHEREKDVTRFWTCSFAEAMDEVRAFHASHGIMIGSSAGANLRIARRIARETPRDRVVVTVLSSLANDGERALVNGRGH